MSEQIEKTRRAFQALAASFGPPAFHDATVVDVDSSTYTCTILLEGEAEVYDVRLRAVQSSNSSIDVLPAVNSSVVVGKLNDDDYILIAADEITSWRASVNKMQLGIDASGITVSNGTDTLNTVMTDLIETILTIAAAKDAATLTALLQRVKALLK